MMKTRVTLLKGQGNHAGGRFLQQFLPLHRDRLQVLKPEDYISKQPQFVFYTVNACWPTKILHRGFCASIGKVHFIEELSPEVCHALKQGKGCLIIDSSNEGPGVGNWYLNELHEIAQQLEISPAQIIWLNQNLAFEDYYRTWADQAGFPAAQRLRIRYYHSLLALFIRELQVNSGETFSHGHYISQLSRTETLRETRFLCLNNAPRPHRLFTVLQLMEQGLLEQGLVSLKSLDHRKKTFADSLAAYQQLFPHHQDLLNSIDRLEQQLPLEVDDTSDPNQMIAQTNSSLYCKTYFSLVTETEMTRGEVCRFTEKTLKPLASLHPFVVMGNPGTLKLLRKMGFKTFDGLIDETYDEIVDPEARAVMALAEVKRLCDMPLQELHQWYQAALPTLIYNTEHCFKVLPTWIQDEMGNVLLQEMDEMAQQVTD